MLETVEITPTKRGQNTSLSCETRINGKWMVLTENWKMLPLEDLSHPDNAGEKIKQIQFSPESHTFKFSFNTEQTPKPDFSGLTEESKRIKEREWKNGEVQNTRMRDAAYSFFPNHLLIKCNTKIEGVVNQPVMEHFQMELTAQRSVSAMVSDMRRVMAFNKVMGMSLQEKYDLAMYFEPSLYGKRHSEILRGLIGLKGIATAEATKGGKLMQEPYLSEFLDNYATNPTVAIKTYINKGIGHGLITKNGTGYYINGSTFIGTSVEEAVGFFSKDNALYSDFLQHGVNQFSQLPDDDMVVFNANYLPNMVINSIQNQIKENPRAFPGQKTRRMILEERAKNMGLKVYPGTKDENLEAKVIEAEKKQNIYFTEQDMQERLAAATEKFAEAQ